ncbi:hypothetical protein FOI68_16925 [Brevibacillus sp. LEMMJ03]|uniref:hypothetical protein n=1 Tax=Brevibacillus sp. LEMMJ03 TaxID=2595056 RepID=UPI00117E7E52|nr:hypothetical protein [Brevibacillus sp. LEMMJ03]TRY24336.1 hypothetical protein FOI68_16925 [Brevibacillus sp. LEMMJ03]
MITVSLIFKDQVIENDFTEAETINFIERIVMQKANNAKLNFYDPEGKSFTKESQELKSIEIKF